jgi:serine/threonine-protein kinase
MDQDTKLTGVPDQPEKSLDRTVETDPLIGRRIDDFLIEKVVGKGGMGVVYEARQISLDRQVALKFLNTSRPVKNESIIRFESEARSAARLSHPNIIHIYALGSFENQPYIVMELVRGQNLGNILKERQEKGLGVLPFDYCISMMLQASMGVQAASEMGLIHRDLKPDNLMITDQGEVKIADFGLARNLNAEVQSLTETGTTMGTPLYMSPEQVQSRSIDKRTDIYSLGMTFHHLLTGKPPLMAESVYALALKQISERPVSVRVLRPDCPESLSELVDWMIEKQPDLRPPSAGEVIRILQEIGGGNQAGVSLLRKKSDQQLVSSILLNLSQMSPAAAQPVPSDRTNRRKMLWFGATSAMVLIGWLAGRQRNRRRAEALTNRAPAWPPGLFLADWKRIEQQKTAEAQYQMALVGVGKTDRVAAWLAVPGYFPAEDDWCWRAYVQLTSEFVRNGDLYQLNKLGQSLAGHGHGILFDHIEEVIEAADHAFEGREAAFLESVDPLVGETMDLNMAELILSLLNTYKNQIPKTETVPKRLEKLLEQLTEILKIS